MSKAINIGGPHTKEAVSILEADIGEKFDAQVECARKILCYSVDPNRIEPGQTQGLLYGLIQSGKTSVITVTAAMAADNGFKCIIILTSSMNFLYNQTLTRIKSQLIGLPVLGKSELSELPRFQQKIRTAPFIIVVPKNINHLTNLSESFKKAGLQAHKLPTFIIDDEADNASLNTNTQKNAKKEKEEEEISTINRLITGLRKYFDTYTFLQVTATPQALFLQEPTGLYRPSFTVLSEPGKTYKGGEVFFESNSKLLRYVDLNEVDELSPGFQPNPNSKIPEGLRCSLLNFIISATVHNNISRKNFAFLCHISHTRVNHEHVVRVISEFHEYAIQTLKDPSSKNYVKLIEELKKEYEDIKKTELNISLSFDEVLAKIKFFLPGASIKGINSGTDHEIILDHVYTIFVGGNKLGRGVTITNLITSYYGRNPKSPTSDTVLQHARMYGYRKDYINATRLFLPERLADHFRSIHQMEKALRMLIATHPEGAFEGIYVENPLKPTRSNVLDPNSIGIYTAGGNYSPRYPLSSITALESTQWLDKRLEEFRDKDKPYNITIDLIIKLINKTQYDPIFGADLWNVEVIAAALEKLKTLKGGGAYLYIQRGRDLMEPRRETQGFLSGGESNKVPRNAPALFLYRVNKGRDGFPTWWPLIRLAGGNYALAFSFER